MSTNRIFFDTDCISSFLWTDKGSIIKQLYKGLIVIPEMVIQELQRTPNSHFPERITELLSSGDGEIWDIDSASEAFDLYFEMTVSPANGKKIVGKGEASAMALAYCHEGTVASNNFKDISSYVHDLNLKHISTGDILVEAFEQGIISEKEGNEIWADMIAADRWIGADSFTDYYNKNPYKPLQNS